MIIPWCFGFILSFWSMAVDIFARAVATSRLRVDPSSRTWHPVPIRYPLLRCWSNAYDVANCFPHASHCVPMPRLGLWAVAGSMVYKRNVVQIARLQIKRMEKSEWNRMVELENPGWPHIQTAFYSFLKEYPHIQCFPSDKKLQYVAALSSRTGKRVLGWQITNWKCR